MTQIQGLLCCSEAEQARRVDCKERNMPDRTPSTSISPGCLGAVFGSIIIHFLLYALTYAWGAHFGATVFVPMSPTGPDPNAEVHYGARGANNSVAVIFYIYLMSLGLVPLIISIVGSIVGALLAHKIAGVLRHFSLKR